MEAAQKKLNDAFDKLANDLLDTTFRGVQLRGFECSVACCKKEKDPKAMQSCVQQCNAPFEQLQQFTDSELKQFQNRISRCAQVCVDKAQEKVRENMSASETMALQKESDACACKCAEDSMQNLGPLKDRVRAYAKKL